MSPRLLLVVLLAAVAAAQANTTTAQVVTTTTPLATSTAAQTTSTAAQTTSSAAQTTSAQSAATTTTSAQQTTVPGAPWSGEQAAGARRFAKQQVALVSVRLVRSSGTGNATVISELAAASFLVEVDRQAQLSLPGSWASAGGSEAQVQVVLLWNKTGVNYTATATLPSPFASSGLSVAYYEAWVGLNAGVPEVSVLRWFGGLSVLTVDVSGGDVADSVQRGDSVQPACRPVLPLFMCVFLLRPFHFAVQLHLLQLHLFCLRRARVPRLARPRRRQPALHLLCSVALQLCPL